jgi:DNA-binding MarR family transcriptional regulator
MTELSLILSTDNSAITGLVDSLERSGFISRKMPLNDRRTYPICITP